MNRLLYVSLSEHGGLADYAHEQSNALASLGLEVSMLAPLGFFNKVQKKYLEIPLPQNLNSGVGHGGRLPNKFARLRRLLRNYAILAETVVSRDCRHVLLGSYAEYFAPLWAWRLRRLASAGVVFGAVVHDPIRDFVLGPLWWHKCSIAAGYSFLREAFVHEAIALDTGRPMPRLHTSVVPHGPYVFHAPSETCEETRRKLQIPDEAKVLLSFGHIRDGKNLDLTIQALADFSNVYLLVAGKEQSSGQKPLIFYQEMAGRLGVDNRCRWLNQHIPENEVGNFFNASDLILLTYSRQFRSASGVLNAAVTFRKPCIASSGGGNLRTVVEKYNLGCFIESDSLPALRQGLQQALGEKLVPRWDRYANENSWERNAQIVKAKLFEFKDETQ